MRITHWPGRLSNADPHDLPVGGAQVQTNWQSLVPGVLSGRGGMRALSFANTTTASTNEVISQYTLHTAKTDFIVYQLSDGTLKAGSSPS